jgi:hypothetical protein
MDADVRIIRAAEYEKFKAAVAQITPVGDTSYDPAPPMTQGMTGQKKTK